MSTATMQIVVKMSLYEGAPRGLLVAQLDEGQYIR